MTSKRIQRQICAAQAGTFCRLCSLFCPKTQDVSADHKRPTEIGPPEFLAKMQLVVPAPSLSYRRTGPPAVWSRAASTASQGFASRTLSSYALSDLLCLQFFLVLKPIQGKRCEPEGKHPALVQWQWRPFCRILPQTTQDVKVGDASSCLHLLPRDSGSYLAKVVCCAGSRVRPLIGGRAKRASRFYNSYYDEENKNERTQGEEGPTPSKPRCQRGRWLGGVADESD